RAMTSAQPTTIPLNSDLVTPKPTTCTVHPATAAEETVEKK
ncbi:8054_t:CDS:1, partial [Dentiscutata erythropus]